MMLHLLRTKTDSARGFYVSKKCYCFPSGFYPADTKFKKQNWMESRVSGRCEGAIVRHLTTATKSNLPT